MTIRSSRFRGKTVLVVTELVVSGTQCNNYNLFALLSKKV